ncbi:methionine ABC transporter ATP-binding protein [Clostridium saccharobutylicum]|uniref:Methionine import ATP-binding protein MetN n=1 Tax=Clostridium saccharobutylicum DSM 13864 TaxID=1345695 RepID=U5MWT7_CLOSA|nr:methionine ABC transporter ATP-binding protein [Clostridium saccharobutylicum]AGX44993.1 methionine import ATP-binding protein MetN [Clostridium saccharobutylicum DSM 13864]AQR92275.1 methionine import ATP-binding protein MetN [Clostridium saccharobutylicum]AQS02177.1 methionine import ATP-binding protein MetN [Clostridium saccharobutylicum]AQS11781.1 methionine import ATP-binding protein MetN [Clostridium saccharobutylicum]AQS16160.1 methionine import ATP-binding protein MetN [Clostridium 
MVEIKNVVKSFGKTQVIKDVSMSIKQGEIYGIIGHSGAGKSTLLRCINGLETYDGGSINVMGKEVCSLSGSELREFRKDLGMIFQNFNLLQRKNVFDNVALPLEVWGYDKKIIETKVLDLLKLVGLEDKKLSKPSQLSGGQKQRVAIARALALDPKILLCDEATSALDPKITKDILALLSKINKELGITIIMVTHQMEVIKEVCQRVALLDGGEIKAEGRAEDLFLKPGTSLKKFLGEEDEEEILPESGVNIKLFFPSNSSENALITKMARELEIDFSIVWGKLEKFRSEVLGGLVINISENDKDKVLKYLEGKEILWEVLK